MKRGNDAGFQHLHRRAELDVLASPCGPGLRVSVNARENLLMAFLVGQRCALLDMYQITGMATSSKPDERCPMIGWAALGSILSIAVRSLSAQAGVDYSATGRAKCLSQIE